MEAYQNYQLKDLEIGDIQPQGWLADQLMLQLKGITGDLDENWGSVGSYADWIGGTDNSWERPPYWLDGLVPLAWLTKDTKAMAKAKRWVRWTMDSQRENGDFGPSYRTEGFDSALFWPKFVMLKVLISYYEATHEAEVLDFMDRYFRFCMELLDTYEMSGWDQAREGDFAYAVFWLYEKTGKEYLLELAGKANAQALDWTGYLADLPFIRPTEYYYDYQKIFRSVNRQDLYDVMRFHLTHIVNVAMGIKQPLMEYKRSGRKECLDAVYQGLESLKEYHGQVTGVFAGDEHLGGTNPTRGSELCSVVELLFSLQLLYRQTKDAYFVDLMERIAFNALPGTITEDFKGHQYDQQANQIKVSTEPRGWYNNGDRANLFGFEPNFGCCLANMHQGWPKLVKNAVLWDGEAVWFGMYLPMDTRVAAAGGEIRIEERTEYPFDGTIRIRVASDTARTVPCRLRIPAWCRNPRLFLNGKEVAISRRPYGEVQAEVGPGAEAEILLELPMEVRTETGWYHNGISVAYGPLVMSLNIREKWSALPYGHPKFPDYEIHPLSPWNYALIPDSFQVETRKGTLSRQAFSKENPPVVIRTKGIRLPQWKEEKGSAGDLPVSPVTAEGEPETVELVPYGCTKLRISVFPWKEPDTEN